MNFNDSDENQIILAALDSVHPLINQEDKEQMKLYSELRSHPNSKNSQKKTIKLLLKVLLKDKYNIQNSEDENSCDCSNNPTVRRLLSHLESHVVLLEAISHNPELASLFLVGSSGSQSFTSLQKSVLMEQAARIRYFTSHFRTGSNCGAISDYRKNLVSPSSLTDLSEKIEELNSIKKSVEGENSNIGKVKNAFKEVCSLLETSVLFNDILIQKYNSNEIFKQNEKLEKQITDIRTKKDSIQNQLKKLKHHIGRNNGCLEDENQIYRQKVAQLENDKAVLLKQLEANNGNRSDTNSCEMKTLKTENRQLASQIDLLNKQIANYQMMISQKDEKISALKGKIDECTQKVNKLNQLSKNQRSEVEEIHKLYKNASNQLAEISDHLNETQLKNGKLQKANSKLTKENSDLKALLERANETNQNHLKDNAILIKQMRQNEENKETEKEEKLKEIIRCLQKKLSEAQKFICKLQNEIKMYKNKNMNSERNPCSDFSTSHSLPISNSNSNSNSVSVSSSEPKNYQKKKKEIKVTYKSNVDQTKSEEETYPSSSSSSSSISLTNKSKNKGIFNKFEDEEEEIKSEKNSRQSSNKYEIQIEEEEEENSEEESFAQSKKTKTKKIKKVLNVDDHIVIKQTKINDSSSDNDYDNSLNDHTKLHITSSIMPSFDELERDIKNLEIGVKKTRNLVSQSLNE